MSDKGSSFGSDPWQRNLIALLVAQALTMVAFSFVLPFLPLYIQFLGVEGIAEVTQWAGVIGAASALSMAVAQPIWGNLADRWGRRPMVIRSMVSASIILTLMGFVASPEQLLALRLLQGVLTGTVTAANALVATSTPRHRLGFALGLMQVAVFVGTSIGPLVGGVISDTFGFRAAFYASGVLLMVGAAIVVLFVQEHRRQPTAGESRRGLWAESRSLLAMTIFPILIGVIFLIQLSGMIVSPVLSLFVAELNGGGNAATVAGTVLAATGAVSAVSALAIGRISDRVGPAVILPICLLGAAISYFPQAMVQEVWHLLLLRVLLGVFVGGLMPTANALVAGLVPEYRRGAAFGLTAAASALANAAGPLAGAGVASHWGMRAVFVATGILFFLAYGWASLGFRKHGVHPPQPQAKAADGEPRPPMRSQ